MSENYVIYMARQTLGVILLVGGPVLGVTLVVGLLVSIFQAITQIQEQTLTFIPKLLAAAIVIIVLGPWMLQTMIGFTTNIFNSLPNFTNF